MVAVIGLGVTGMSQVATFHDHEVVTYDPDVHDSYPWDKVADCDFAIVCVGTPAGEDGHADLSYVRAAARDLPPLLPVMLRSTVPPGTTDELFAGTGRLYVHAPEFMGENTLHSWQRSVDVPYMIIGGSPTAAVFFKTRFARVFPGTIHTCAAVESELAKYAANLYWATRVTFVNEFAKVCGRFGVDYEHVRAAWLTDPRMSGAYTQRAGCPAGFAGRCWPKDLDALIAASSDAGYDPGFLRAVREANARYRDEEWEWSAAEGISRS
jgi:nucleotide sugar dehydrogenase